MLFFLCVSANDGVRIMLTTGIFRALKEVHEFCAERRGLITKQIERRLFVAMTMFKPNQTKLNQAFSPIVMTMSLQKIVKHAIITLKHGFVEFFWYCSN